MTMLEFANKFLLQWLFIRLAEVKKVVITIDYTMEETEDGSFCAIKTGGSSALKKELKWYSIQGWIPPLVGWKTKFPKPVDRKSNWSIRVSEVKEEVKVEITEQDWIGYLESTQYGYGCCHHHKRRHKEHKEIDIELLVSYGQIVDEQIVKEIIG